jgi:hypothetical protein
MLHYKTEGGGQFFQIDAFDQAKIVSIYKFNPVIEKRQISTDAMVQLKCIPCTEAEFNDAQAQAMQLLDLPPAISA